MNRELEALLKAWDEFIQTPEGPEADRIYVFYQRGSTKRLQIRKRAKIRSTSR